MPACGRVMLQEKSWHENRIRHPGMTIVLPVHQGCISPVLDVAGRLLCLHIENGMTTERREIGLESTDPQYLIQQIRKTEPDFLICGALSNEMEFFLKEAGIHVMPHLCGNIEKIINTFYNTPDLLSQFAMPGCCHRLHYCQRNHKQCRKHGTRTT
jgi:predicted Fe-Mo cluster-binding NifX family protein